MIGQWRRSPAWDDLLVVLIADHAYPYPAGLPYNVGRRHRIPMIWTGGAVAGPAVVEEYGSQIDLAATLLGQMEVDHTPFIYSKDLLSPSVPKFGYWCFNEGFRHRRPAGRDGLRLHERQGADRRRPRIGTAGAGKGAASDHLQGYWRTVERSFLLICHPERNRGARRLGLPDPQGWMFCNVETFRLRT